MDASVRRHCPQAPVFLCTDPPGSSGPAKPPVRFLTFRSLSKYYPIREVFPNPYSGASSSLSTFLPYFIFLHNPHHHLMCVIYGLSYPT